MASELYSLKWVNHRSTFLNILSKVHLQSSYSDVTVACGDAFFPLHKLVLASCSEYFEELFRRTTCKHPVIVLKDVLKEDFEALTCYMYLGKVNVQQENIPRLITAAECLKIKGLAIPDDHSEHLPNVKRNRRPSGGSLKNTKRQKTSDTSEACNASSDSPDKTLDVSDNISDHDEGLNESNQEENTPLPSSHMEAMLSVECTSFKEEFTPHEETTSNCSNTSAIPKESNMPSSVSNSTSLSKGGVKGEPCCVIASTSTVGEENEAIDTLHEDGDGKTSHYDQQVYYKKLSELYEDTGLNMDHPMFNHTLEQFGEGTTTNNYGSEWTSKIPNRPCMEEKFNIEKKLNSQSLLLRGLDRKVDTILLTMRGPSIRESTGDNNPFDDTAHRSFTDYLPPPAENLEQLHSILENQLLAATLITCVGKNPLDTARKIIRRIMSKELALQFSLTGLGEKRQKVKLSFKDHEVCKPVLETLGALYGTSQSEGLACIRDVLKGTRDWDGGRKMR